ncbi:MAG: response regulator, partial [Pyrinomonadaceae bacterium]
DSVTIRKVVELTFADEGIEVSAVADGDSAMQKFVEIHPDIVLLDVGLPGTSGYDLCEMIKQDDATKHIPVLLLVGSFEPFDQDEAERVGADGFLTKPFHSIRELVSRVWELLGKDPTVVETEGETEIESEEIQTSDAGGVAEPDERETDEDPTDGAGAIVSDAELNGVANEDPTATSHAADIDELYRSSLDPDAELKDFDRVDDIFLDSSMDDDLIEASHPGREDGDLEPEAVNESAAKTEFDWSPGSVVTDPVSEVADRDSAVISEPNMDGRGVDEDVTGSTDDSISNGLGTEFDWSAASIVTTTPVEPEPGQTVEDTAMQADGIDEDDILKGDTLDMSLEDGSAESIDEPSAEFIALVAQQVVEKLSDQIIRDIAKEAVPRIAEKMIREALEEEKKS